MNEPICLARKRADGAWVILASPSKNFSEANTAFQQNNNPVNEVYDRVIIGKIIHTRPACSPLSAKQQESRLAQVSEQTKKVQDIAAGARDRQNEIEQKEREKTNLAQVSERNRAEEIAKRVRDSQLPAKK